MWMAKEFFQDRQWYPLLGWGGGSVKHLPHKHEGFTRILSTHIWHTAAHLQSQQEGPWALQGLMTPRFHYRPCLYCLLST